MKTIALIAVVGLAVSVAYGNVVKHHEPWTCTDDEDCKAGHAKCNLDFEICECIGGYERDDDCNVHVHHCNDIDECKCVPPTHNCTDYKHTHCNNYPGGFECKCNVGYQPNAEGECIDIDDCDVKPDPCDGFEHTHCVEWAGIGRECRCNEGYEGPPKFCRDIVECNEYTCGKHATCCDAHGSYDCQCDHGFYWGPDGCQDIDECLNDLDNCDWNACCSDIDGSFECECYDGYEGSGTTGNCHPISSSSSGHGSSSSISSSSSGHGHGRGRSHGHGSSSSSSGHGHGRSRSHGSSHGHGSSGSSSGHGHGSGHSPARSHGHGSSSSSGSSGRSHGRGRSHGGGHGHGSSSSSSSSGGGGGNDATIIETFVKTG